MSLVHDDVQHGQWWKGRRLPTLKQWYCVEWMLELMDSMQWWRLHTPCKLCLINMLFSLFASSPNLISIATIISFLEWQVLDRVVIPLLYCCHAERMRPQSNWCCDQKNCARRYFCVRQDPNKWLSKTWSYIVFLRLVSCGCRLRPYWSISFTVRHK